MTACLPRVRFQSSVWCNFAPIGRTVYGQSAGQLKQSRHSLAQTVANSDRVVVSS